MSEESSVETMRDQIEELRSRQEHHERLARKHREAALRFWRKRAALELLLGEGVETGASSEETPRPRAHGR